MTENRYKYISIVLGVLVVILFVMLISQPKQVNTAALQQDLAQFRTALEQWNAQYGKNPTPDAKSKLSDELSAFAQKLGNYR